MRGRITAIVALTCMACGAGQVAPVAPPTPLEEAIAAREQGQLDAAEVKLQVLASQGDRRATLELAETLLRRGKHAAAVEKLRPMYVQGTEDADLCELMARALDGAGQPDEAIAAYAHRLRLQPRDTQSALRMTELLVGRGDLAAACQVAEAALQIAPDHAGLHMALSRALLGRGRVPSALTHAKRATELRPTDAQPWWQTAQVHMMEGELDKAKEALEQALKNDPQHADALRDMGILLVELGDPRKGASVLQKAAQIAPDNATIWMALGMARQRDKDLLSATAALEQAQRLAPKAPQIYVALADVALDHGQPRRAQGEARRARERLTQQSSTELRGRVDALLVRSIVVATLAEALCQGQADGSAAQSSIDKALREEGLQVSNAETVKVAAEATTQIRAAQARCKPAAPAASP